MERSQSDRWGSRAPSSIAVTGVHTVLGRRLVERWAADPRAPRIVVLDCRRPLDLPEGVHFEPVDLTRSTADGRLAEALAAAGVEALVHLAFRTEPTRDVEADHELETIGTLHLLQAAGDVGLRRLVVASSTMLYGARPDNPNFLDESSPLRGNPDAHCVADRIEVEGLVERWARRRPDADVCVLRGCWVVGPRTRQPGPRYLSRSSVPIVLGYDPLMQLVHEDDWLHAFEVATREGVRGVYNVVGHGVAPLTVLLRSAGRRVLPLPYRWLERAWPWLGPPSPGDPPAAFFDYLRYLWVADGARGWSVFGEPVYSTREAWASVASTARLRRAA